MRIYKYPLLSEVVQKITMPKGAQVLEAGVDGENRICVWALVDESEPETEDQKIFALMTGETIPDALDTLLQEGIPTFVGTVNWKASAMRPLLVHIFWVDPQRERDFRSFQKGLDEMLKQQPPPEEGPKDPSDN